MAASPGCLAAVMSAPPLRGVTGVLMLLVLGLALFMPDVGLGLGGRAGFVVFALLLGAYPWAATLSGFLDDVGVPDAGDGATTLAHRTRGAAVTASWAALGMTILGLPLAVLLLVRAPDHPALVVTFVGAPLCLLTAALLPRLSRRYALGAGAVLATPTGLVVRLPGTREDRSEGYAGLRVVGEDPCPGASLPGRLTDGLDERVRWRPGAREAVARWSAEGFAPTATEVRELGLDPTWSADQPATTEAGQERRTGIATHAGAVVVCALLAAALVHHGLTAEGSSRWIALLGCGPVAGLVLLVPRLARMLREDPDEPVRLDPDGWVDKYHGQGLVRWHEIAALEVHADGCVLLHSRPDERTFRDRDLANRANARVERWQRNAPVQIASAGPGYRTVGATVLVYPPQTGVRALLDEAERIARPFRRDPLVVACDDASGTVAS